MCLLCQSAFSQTKNPGATDQDTTELLGLPGDNLDLYAVLSLFQKSKTIEGFEKSLNDEKTGINNLDLDLNKKVDFIKVTTKQDGNAFAFTLQVDVTKTETQNIASILVNKDKNDKISIQAVGDEDIYGKDYVIEPKGNSSVTANPGYTGTNPVTVNVPATEVTVVQAAPVVQYVYSPAYVPYTPPYYYGYYPPWFGFGFTVMAVGIYRSACWGYHGGYYGGHYGGSYRGGNNNVIINTGNRNQINQINNNRNRSNTVANNKGNGNYGTGSRNRPSTGTADRGGANRPSAGTSNRPNAGTSNRPSTGTSNVGGSNRSSASSRPSTSNMSSSGRTRSGGGGYGGGGFSGGSRGGGGGGRRR